MLNDYYEFKIAGHWLPALVNDDFTGLSDAEANLVEDWIYPHLKQLPDMTVAVLFDEGRGFAEDEISGLYADCYAVRLYFTNNNLGN
jgi:hypothetical protein